MPPASRQSPSVTMSATTALPVGKGSSLSPAVDPRGTGSQTTLGLLSTLQNKLTKATEQSNAGLIDSLLRQLKAVPVTSELIQSARVGTDFQAVRELMKKSADETIRVRHTATFKGILQKWASLRKKAPSGTSPNARKGQSPLTPRTPSNATAPASPLGASAAATVHCSSAQSAAAVVANVPSPAPSSQDADVPVAPAVQTQPQPSLLRIKLSVSGTSTIIERKVVSSTAAAPAPVRPQLPTLPSLSERKRKHDDALEEVCAKRRRIASACAPEGLIAGVDGCFASNGDCVQWHAWADAFAVGDLSVASYALPF
eukprot:Opistho-2@63229